jgi:hypothetical protein
MEFPARNSRRLLHRICGGQLPRLPPETWRQRTARIEKPTPCLPEKGNILLRWLWRRNLS